ncbi:release factor glutamine methyltransferase [Agaricicola taiwanensis]|uniref:Release factor glutamine methyltransferase n=1 Tax=Agaricicola taiwanensis TaxID=591372 RepID=A0A8J2YMZ5_9RHOB|nr:peptide chain release factor N(5)-glutamine methyltransferase [Agaricicola taiwanensis]GGE55422.1 release factor glutamine methyltransferase [Agaricicola taiwanensis]
MTRGELLAEARGMLRGAGNESGDADARILVAAALEITGSQLLSRPEVEVSAELTQRARDWIARRAGGVPVARLIGTREFWGLPFALSPATLVPRPDTETLVEAVVEARPDRNARLRILDLGTGSGCILLALLSEYWEATGLGTDLSEEAVATARFNAEELGFADRAFFQRGSWDEGLSERFDVVVSNPPYIPSSTISSLDVEVREHDPALALDGGADGLEAYRALAALLPARLLPNGVAALEIGIGQEAAVGALMQARGFDVTARRDLAGVTRVLVLSRLSENPLGNAGLRS